MRGGRPDVWWFYERRWIRAETQDTLRQPSIKLNPQWLWIPRQPRPIFTISAQRALSDGSSEAASKPTGRLGLQFWTKGPFVQPKAIQLRSLSRRDLRLRKTRVNAWRWDYGSPTGLGSAHVPDLARYTTPQCREPPLPAPGSPQWLQ